MMEQSLYLQCTGRPGCGRLVVGQLEGQHAVLETGAAMPFTGGSLGSIELEGPVLGGLSGSDCYRLMRHCRHLLAPGGKLSVQVGSLPGEIDRERLNQAAWRTGYLNWIDYVSGCAVLTKPARQPKIRPLVSIVMPVYKAEFFAAALASAQAQSWDRCEIVVCDDSPGEDIARMTKQSAGPHPLRYIRNPGNIGGRANYLQCFAEARGLYVKFLNDDDLLHPECVARMATVLSDHPDVTLVTSYRRLIDENGETLPDAAYNFPLSRHDGLVDGRILAGYILTRGVNQIGEPTTVMFRKSDMADSEPHLMSYAGLSAHRNGDMSIWTSLLSRGDAVFLTEALSSFRQHGSQVQKGEDFQREAVAAWLALRVQAKRTGLWDEAGTLLNKVQPLPTAEEQTGDGEALFAAGDSKGAATVFEALLERDPSDAQTRGNLACAYWELGQREDALLQGTLACCNDPKNETTLLNLQDMMAANA